MHELGLISSVLTTVLARMTAEDATRVTLVSLAVGALCNAEHASLRFCFTALARGTAAADAELELIEVPGEARCLDCGWCEPVVERGMPCRGCAGMNLRIDGGDSVMIREIEVE